MSSDPVSARYAEALFRLAQRKGRLEAVARDVERLARELESPAAARLFDARLPLDQRRALLAPLVAGLDPLLANFAGLVFDKRRENVLRRLGVAFRSRILAEQGVLEGVVESARPLGAGELAELEVALGASFKKRLKLSTRTNPNLLAGVRVFAAGQLIDASAKGRLEALERRLMNAPLPR